MGLVRSVTEIQLSQGVYEFVPWGLNFKDLMLYNARL